MKHVNESGRSMVEMLGVLAIIGVLSVGGIAGYSKAMSKYKINKTVDQVTMLVANIRTMFSSQSSYGSDFKNSKAVAYGVVPNDMGTGSSLLNPYAGAATIKVSDASADGDNAAFTITYAAIPQDACRTILTSDWGSDLGSGLIAIGANTSVDTIKSVYVGTTSEKTPPAAEADAAPATGVEAIKTPKNGLPFSIGEAFTVCGATNTITWKYY